ncbi:unnamed protein product [Symbiodinium natans]|uniref:Uncharacterized protein n=1 Tax=Symbiodinium natans TaxID=878477 RepID=A0A812P033_9DINO|nr:unnamed protein product [Symbiodinium natans]
MVEIQEKLLLAYEGGPLVPIPEEFLFSNTAGKFLRLRVSHAGICKLIAGNKYSDLFKQVRNPSLSSGPNYKKLLDEIQTGYHRQAKQLLASASSGSAGGEDFFEDGGEQADKVRPKKVLIKDDMPPILELMLDGTPIKVATPPSFRNMVASVLVEETNLKNCFDFLSKDIPNCWGDAGEQQKRKYRKKS